MKSKKTTLREIEKKLNEYAMEAYWEGFHNCRSYFAATPDHRSISASEEMEHRRYKKGQLSNVKRMIRQYAKQQDQSIPKGKVKCTSCNGTGSAYEYEDK
jgi:hypothetical protein